jgi:NMD protein affecting ribosome stability and mRNA decay
MRRAYLRLMRRNCPACRQIWEDYYRAALQEYASHEILAEDSRRADPLPAASRQAVAELASIEVKSLRDKLAAHLESHAADEPR